MLYIPREICESWPSKALPKQGKQDTFTVVIKTAAAFLDFYEPYASYQCSFKLFIT